MNFDAAYTICRLFGASKFVWLCTILCYITGQLILLEMKFKIEKLAYAPFIT